MSSDGNYYSVLEDMEEEMVAILRHKVGEDSKAIWLGSEDLDALWQHLIDSGFVPGKDTNLLDNEDLEI